jgi:hypothetical protein
MEKTQDTEQRQRINTRSPPIRHQRTLLPLRHHPRRRHHRRQRGREPEAAQCIGGTCQ